MERMESTMPQTLNENATMENTENNAVIQETLLGETVLELLLPFLHAPELAAVAKTNQRFYQMVQERDALWVPTYQYWDGKCPMASTRTLTDEDFWHPDDFVRVEMRIPSRLPPRPTSNNAHCRNSGQPSPLHGSWTRRRHCQYQASHDGDSSNSLVPRKRIRTALEHSNDGHSIPSEDVDNAPIYFMDYGVYCHWRVDESGNLLDSPSNNSSLWARREYPVHCQDCQVTLHSTEQLVDHCTSPMHMYCKCPALLDPRRTTAFASMSYYEKAKAIWHFPEQVESFFRQQIHLPPNQYRMHQFLGLLEGTIAYVLQRDSIVDSKKDLYPERTVQEVSQYCVEWMVHKALHFDFYNHAKQVAYVGWQAIDFYQSGLGYDLCLSLTGIPPHHFDYLIKD